MIHDALEFAYATGVRIRIRFVKTRVGHDVEVLGVEIVESLVRTNCAPAKGDQRTGG